MSKTCGDCRFYFEQAEFCRKNAWECIEEDKECCDEFEKPTNGDVIRQMSNEELVDTIDELAFKFSSRREFLNWLNAPAESEGKDE
jgi:hypothetical protein